MKLFLPALVVLLSLLAAPATAQDYDKGVASYERGDYVAALWKWRPLAEQGDAQAQYELGQSYFRGRGVLRDYTEAAKWFRLAAEKGYAEAQVLLGGMYTAEQGVPLDYVQGYMWVNLAVAGELGKETLEAAIELRNIIENLMTSTDVSKAQRMAREWQEAHPQ